MLKTIIVDDERPALKVLEFLLKQYENIEIVEIFTDIHKMFEKIKKDSIDLIFLDIEMPNMNGIEVAERILKIDSHIQIVFVTAYNNYAIEAFEMNVVDYIVKPVLKRRLDKTIKRILEKYLVMKKIDELTLTVNTDCLTNLYNRRYMTKRIEEEIARYKRNKKAFSLVISDIDFFKKVNDMYGHDCGDYVLKKVSKRMLRGIRKQDVLSRWGGEEFIFLFPETNLKEAKILCERIREKIEKESICYNDIKIYITMSFGVALFDRDESIDEIIKNADKALYKSKTQGRNCVCIYE